MSFLKRLSEGIRVFIEKVNENYWVIGIRYLSISTILNLYYRFYYIATNKKLW